MFLVLRLSYVADDFLRGTADTILAILCLLRYLPKQNQANVSRKHFILLNFMPWPKSAQAANSRSVLVHVPPRGIHSQIPQMFLSRTGISTLSDSFEERSFVTKRRHFYRSHDKAIYRYQKMKRDRSPLNLEPTDEQIFRQYQKPKRKDSRGIRGVFNSISSLTKYRRQKKKAPKLSAGNLHSQKCEPWST